MTIISVCVFILLSRSRLTLDPSVTSNVLASLMNLTHERCDPPGMHKIYRG